MKTHNLKLFNTGQVTLPKSRREQYNTNLFLAEETPHGLLIKPLINENQNTSNAIDIFIEAFKTQALKQGFNENEIEEMIKLTKKAQL
ncbi:hypothetical protein [Flavobacterium sp.]|uniref:hypothetical protein n=1 Tax=Flavobacterium sp. TaxID=239 RepID=UPI0026165FE2|nr:hypothetical protein [Flavobacterium sp.]MDD2987134.1 hypothetical protein [Flavobacterium sp.]